ncbi:energy-coupling factor transporter ATPase [candidate division KSB1 bacterium]|nr:energy-coupling factor transporter ATPase [candidate division KSB1 bacterium]
MAIHLHCDDLSFRYRGIGASAENVLDSVSFDLDHPSCIAVVGPSGSGKTTLIQHFTGLLKPDSGTVRIDDEDIHSKGYALNRLRQRIGLVFQFPENQLFEETVATDVAFGPRNMGLAPEVIDRQVQSALEDVALPYEKFARRSPFQLSEGEKRRAAIAGILAMQPEMVVFDEPTAGLDPKSVHRIEELCRRLCDSGRIVVVITHHMDFVANIADRALVLAAGRLLFDGTPRCLFARPDLLAAADLQLPPFIEELAELAPVLPAQLERSLNMQEFLDRLKKLAF